jgi:hypothetical protein
MCMEVDDDFIEELAMGRGQRTKEETHVLECCECQERLRQSREWIANLRQAFAAVQRGEEPELKKRPMQQSKSPTQQPGLPLKRGAN